jgi:hypothetical protein
VSFSVIGGSDAPFVNIGEVAGGVVAGGDDATFGDAGGGSAGVNDAAFGNAGMLVVSIWLLVILI